MVAFICAPYPPLSGGGGGTVGAPLVGAILPLLIFLVAVDRDLGLAPCSLVLSLDLGAIAVLVS